MGGLCPCVFWGDDVLGDAEVSIDLLDGLGRELRPFRMRSEEPLSVGRTTVQTWWVLRVTAQARPGGVDAWSSSSFRWR